MSHGFHFAVIQIEGCLNQRFAVSGRTGTGNPGCLWHHLFQLAHGADGSL